MSRHIVSVFAVCLLLMACGTADEPSKDALDANTNGEPLNESHCFLQVTEGAARINGSDTLSGAVDSLFIRMDILGELVTGVYNWSPQEKDHRTGSFQGTIADDLITAVYTYTAEGRSAKEEVLFKLDNDQLRIGYGELREAEGVWVLVDRSQATYGDPIPEVDCQ